MTGLTTTHEKEIKEMEIRRTIPHYHANMRSFKSSSTLCSQMELSSQPDPTKSFLRKIGMIPGTVITISM